MIYKLTIAACHEAAAEHEILFSGSRQFLEAGGALSLTGKLLRRRLILLPASLSNDGKYRNAAVVDHVCRVQLCDPYPAQ